MSPISVSYGFPISGKSNERNRRTECDNLSYLQYRRLIHRPSGRRSAVHVVCL